MSDWKKNKAVGIVAGVISVLAIIMLIKTLTARPEPRLIKGDSPPIPLNTPFVTR